MGKTSTLKEDVRTTLTRVIGRLNPVAEACAQLSLRSCGYNELHAGSFVSSVGAEVEETHVVVHGAYLRPYSAIAFRMPLNVAVGGSLQLQFASSYYS